MIDPAAEVLGPFLADHRGAEEALGRQPLFGQQFLRPVGKSLYEAQVRTLGLLRVPGVERKTNIPEWNVQVWIMVNNAPGARARPFRIDGHAPFPGLQMGRNRRRDGA